VIQAKKGGSESLRQDVELVEDVRTPVNCNGNTSTRAGAYAFPMKLLTRNFLRGISISARSYPYLLTHAQVFLACLTKLGRRSVSRLTDVTCTFHSDGSSPALR